MAVLDGVQRVDHLGFTVPDLDEAQAFFVDVLGARFRYRLGRREGQGTWMSEHLGVRDDAVITEIRFFDLAGLVVELFAYDSPGQAAQPPANSDVGGHHLALYVEDLDGAVGELRAAGVEVQGMPTASGGLHDGQRWIYFRAPWGMQFELVSYPDGRAIDRAAAVASGGEGCGRRGPAA